MRGVVRLRSLPKSGILQQFRNRSKEGFYRSRSNLAADMENKHVVLKTRPGVDGIPRASHFSCEPCSSISELAPGEILVKTCYLSVDPAQRTQMNESTGADYVPPWILGETIIGFSGVGSVLKSSHQDYHQGDLIYGAPSFPWKKYFSVDVENSSDNYQKLDKSLYGLRPSLAISLLGLSGLTAYFGIREKGHIKRGSTCVVSGAAGSCGSLAGQIARIDGCERVVGICGTEEKCRWLVEDLGFDVAINYQHDDVGGRLREACPHGVQVYFDNVGGNISDEVIENMTRDSHIVLCGQISLYNQDVPHVPPLPYKSAQIVTDRNITREEYLVLDYAPKFEQALMELKKWHNEGKIKVGETVVEGLEKTGEAFSSMMSGGNIGKQIVHVADP